MDQKPFAGTVWKGLFSLLGAVCLLTAIFFLSPLKDRLIQEPEPPTLPAPPENPYQQEDFYHDGEFILHSGTPPLIGIDVSDHQNEIDWKQVADAGVSFAMIRAGYRGYTEGGIFPDARWEENIDGALDAGLQVGVYFYSQALSVEEAEEEAAFVIEAIGARPIAYPVVFDWECIGPDARTYGATAQQVTENTDAFCSMVKRAGFIPMFYFNQSMAKDTFQLRKLQNYDFWLAQYDDAMTFPYDVQMWQYTASGHVAGIQGNVDLNLSFKDYGNVK